MYKLTKKQTVLGLILVSAIIFGGMFLWSNEGRFSYQTLENGINYKTSSSDFDFVKEPSTADKFDYLKVHEGLSKLRSHDGNVYIVWEICNTNLLDKKELSYYVTDVEQKEDRSNLVQSSTYDILKEKKINEHSRKINCIEIDNKTGATKCDTDYYNTTEYIWESSNINNILTQANDKCIMFKQNLKIPEKPTISSPVTEIDIIPKLGNYEYPEWLTVSSSDVVEGWALDNNFNDVKGLYNGTSGLGFTAVNQKLGTHALAGNGANVVKVKPVLPYIIGTDVWTINMWVRLNAVANNDWFFELSQGGSEWIAVTTNDAQTLTMYARKDAGSQALLQTPLPEDDGYRMITAIFKNGDYELFVNATSMDTDATVVNAVTLNSNVTLAGRYSGVANLLHANCFLDEIMIFDKELSQVEINELYNDYNGLAYPYETPNTPPAVLDVTPANNTLLYGNNTFITYATFHDNESLAGNLTLYLDDGSGWTENGTAYDVANDTGSNITVTITYDVDYEFLIEGTDGTERINTTIFNTSAFQVVNEPSIEWLSPLNNTINYTSRTPYFNFYPEDNDTTPLTVNLWSNGGLNLTNATITNGTNQRLRFDSNAPNGDYNIILDITDTTNYTNTSTYNISIDFDPLAIINLNPASNIINSTNRTPAFTGTVLDNHSLYENITLYLDGVPNNTIEVNNNSFIIKPDSNFNNGSHEWIFEGVNYYSRINTTARTIFIYDAFSFNITNPNEGEINNTFTPTENITLEWDIGIYNLTNCWYFNGTGNVSVTCYDNETVVEDLPAGNHTLILYINDSEGNEYEDNVSFYINYLQITAFYLDPVIESQIVEFSYNITASLINNCSGQFQYNSTWYNATATYNSTFCYLTNTLTTPIVGASIDIDFNWTYNLNNLLYNSSAYSHTITFLTAMQVNYSCGIDMVPSYCWNFKEESNLTVMIADEVQYNFEYGIGDNSTLKKVYGNLSNVSYFCTCINSSITNYTVGYGELKYKREGYTDRSFYTFSNNKLTSTQVNDTLFFLYNADATSFLFTFKATNLDPYIEKYMSLIRWYPQLDTYDTVEMAKSDDKGQSVMRVKVEDVDYRVGLHHQSGELIKLFNPIRFACLTSPCEYAQLVSDEDTDYTSIYGIESELDYNYTSGVWTFIYNDPSQNTESMTLNVTIETGVTSVQICSNTATGYIGVLTCDTSAYSGTLRGIAYRTASPSIPIAQEIISTSISALRNFTGLFIGGFIALTLFLVGIFINPIVSIILGVVGLIPAVYFGTITISVLIGIGTLGGIIIHFIRRSQR